MDKRVFSKEKESTATFLGLAGMVCEDGDRDKEDIGPWMDAHGSVDDEQMDTLPLPSTYEGDLDPVTSKSTLLEPRYKVL